MRGSGDPQKQRSPPCPLSPKPQPQWQRDVLPIPDVAGEVKWVEIDVGTAADDADHRLDDEEVFRVAVARQ
jgi:hypothetical protein